MTTDEKSWMLFWIYDAIAGTYNYIDDPGYLSLESSLLKNGIKVDINRYNVQIILTL